MYKVLPGAVLLFLSVAAFSQSALESFISERFISEQEIHQVSIELVDNTPMIFIGLPRGENFLGEQIYQEGYIIQELSKADEIFEHISFLNNKLFDSSKSTILEIPSSEDDQALGFSIYIGRNSIRFTPQTTKGLLDGVRMEWDQSTNGFKLDRIDPDEL